MRVIVVLLIFFAAIFNSSCHHSSDKKSVFYGDDTVKSWRVVGVINNKTGVETHLGDTNYCVYQFHKSGNLQTFIVNSLETYGIQKDTVLLEEVDWKLDKGNDTLYFHLKPPYPPESESSKYHLDEVNDDNIILRGINFDKEKSLHLVPYNRIIRYFHN